ncbi:MAG: nitrogen assimilation response regulator NtrX [Rhodospirillales bacterium]
MIPRHKQDILIVDDEADIRALTAGILEDEGYTTRTAENSEEALEEIADGEPSLVLLDIWLQDSKLDGLQILQKIRENHTETPVLMMSGHGTIETAVQAIKDGAYDFIEKPFNSDRLLHLAGRAIEAGRLRRENRELRLRSGGGDSLSGASPEISAVRDAVKQIAQTNARAMFTGSPGAGKEVAARMLHRHSRRAAGPFIVVNCAVLDPERVETFLFGSESGAEREIGFLERADGGTMLLDEVADLPQETQGRLVRILQDQTFQRVGGAEQVQVDVRIVSSCRRDLTAEVEAGRFRGDLFYRINVVPVHIPDLRLRRGDIAQLARDLMSETAGQAGKKPRIFSNDGLTALEAYDWPGNAREMRNIVERLFILAPGGTGDPITAEMMPAEIVAAAPMSGEGMGELLELPLREAREKFERKYLELQYQRFAKSASKTAEFIGMERSALHRKLKLLGVYTRGKQK